MDLHEPDSACYDGWVMPAPVFQSGSDVKRKIRDRFFCENRRSVEIVKSIYDFFGMELNRDLCCDPNNTRRSWGLAGKPPPLGHPHKAMTTYYRLQNSSYRTAPRPPWGTGGARGGASDKNPRVYGVSSIQYPVWQMMKHYGSFFRINLTGLRVLSR